MQSCKSYHQGLPPLRVQAAPVQCSHKHALQHAAATDISIRFCVSAAWQPSNAHVQVTHMQRIIQAMEQQAPADSGTPLVVLEWHWGTCKLTLNVKLLAG